MGWERMVTRTDGGHLTETQTAILELAADDDSLTNREIAERVGTHVALVRDTLSAHADHFEPSEDPAGTESTETAAAEPDPADLSETQETILALAAGDTDLTNREIAEQTGTNVAIVRDTRSTYEGTVAPSDLDAEVPSDGGAAADAGSDASATTADAGGGIEGGKLVALVVVILLLLGIAVLAL